MCMSTPKAPTPPPPPPPPAPMPIPQAADTSPIQTADQRRGRVEAMKYGAISTIKTSGRGITGTGPDLAPVGAGGIYGQKKNLGS